MAVFNAAKREIDIKIVYYGPALCGKTTNVQCVHKMLSPTQRGDIMSLATKDDRTLFFDFLPIELGDVKGFKTRFHVYTVPGQVYYALTRRAVLTGVDGVVFVADSQASKFDENIESLQDLNENLNYYKKDLSSIPFVMQYNKRDMDNVLPVAELNQKINSGNVPYYAASAVDGTGVIETLTACCKLFFKQMDSSGGAKKRRRQRQEEASPLPSAPLPSATPPQPQVPSPPAPVSSPLSFDDDDEGPVIKIISDDDFSPAATSQSSSSSSPISSFDKAVLDAKDSAPASDTGKSALNDVPAMGSSFDTDSPDLSPKSSVPEDESFLSLDTLKSPATPSGLDLHQDDAVSELSSFDGHESDNHVAMPAPPSKRPSDTDADDLSAVSMDTFTVEECGAPKKITAKAVNVPLKLKNKRSGQLCTVTVTVSFDDFSIT
jgi:signal recognition particle receptor subunit beta